MNIENETKEDRKRRLNRERVARHRAKHKYTLKVSFETEAEKKAYVEGAEEGLRAYRLRNGSAAG